MTEAALDGRDYEAEKLSKNVRRRLAQELNGVWT